MTYSTYFKTTAYLFILLFALAPALASADYPDKPIKVIVPYGPGGDSDLATRVWADAVEDILDNPVVVVNKSGGGGAVGTTEVANSKPDGYTLMNAGLGNVLVLPNFSNTLYDFDSFKPIAKLSSVPLGILVNADSPYKSFDDFIAAAKKKDLTQGSWGASSSGTILARIIAKQAGYQVSYVNATTTANSMSELAGGHIDSAVSFPPAFNSYVDSGKARLLVINEDTKKYPDAPTFDDYGIDGNFEGWSGIFAPKGVPDKVVKTLREATRKAMKKPEVIKAFRNMGAQVDFRYGDDWVQDMLDTYQLMSKQAKEMKGD